MNISLLITAILVAYRKKILDKLNRNNLVGNVIFIISLIAFLTIGYMTTFTVTSSISMNKDIAKDFVGKILERENNYELTQIGEVVFVKHSNQKNNYIIKSILIDDRNQSYYLFAQSTCSLLKGCSLNNEKIAIVDKDYVDNIKEYWIRGLFGLHVSSIELYDEKICADFHILKKLKHEIKEKQPNLNTIEIINIKKIESRKNHNILLDNRFKYTHSCSAELKLSNQKNIMIGYDIFVDAFKNSNIELIE